MAGSPGTRGDEGHRRFAAEAFNRAWELIGRSERTDDETEEMVDAAHASAWHWRYRVDRSAKTDSVSAWQLSRVYALAGDPERAARFGATSLQIAQDAGLDPFYAAYAHEALARAAAVAGQTERARRHVESAARAAAEVADHDDRALVEADLAVISSSLESPEGSVGVT